MVCSTPTQRHGDRRLIQDSSETSGLLRPKYYRFDELQQLPGPVNGHLASLRSMGANGSGLASATVFACVLLVSRSSDAIGQFSLWWSHTDG